MKNFTNNFKQFTSRLSARWLIMALMLLVGTSSAWAAKVYFLNNKSWTDIKIYYWGGTAESIGWDGSKSMTSTGDKINGYDVYSYDFGDKAPGNIIFRGSGKQTVDITYSANTCWQLGTESGGKYSVSVETYTPSQSATFSFSLPNELYVGTPADITYTLSPNAAGTVSFSCTTNNATINGTQITANSTGTVTVKATISYNNGYTGTTSTSKSTTAYIPKGVKLYLKPTGWTGDGAKFSAYLFTGTTTNTWATASSVCNDSDVYEIIVPSGKWTNLIWCRMNPSGDQEDWSGSWGQTVDLTYEGKNLYTIDNAYGCGDNKSCGVWGTYTPPSCCTTVNAPNVTADAICAGNTATLTLSERQEGVTYRLNNSTTGDIIFSTEDTYTTPTLNGNTTYKIYASHASACTNNVEGSVTVTVNQPPTKQPTLSSDKTTLATGEKATLTVSNTEDGITYTLYKDGTSTEKTGTSFTNITAGKYKVVATDANSCGSMDSNEITISDCPAVPTLSLSIEQVITDNCDDVTNGIIAISNYASFQGCTFTLNDDAVTPTKEGKIEVTAPGTCTVVATNSCGNNSTAVIEMTKTTIRAPRTDFEVSLSYPQVAFAQNNGSVNIDLSGSERNVTYYLYKNDVKVDGSKTLSLEGKALRWTVSESGTYTVKADNPCNGEIAMTGSVEFTCMSNLQLAFEGGKSTFCPGETANVIVTFNGTGKGNDETNPGKYGWQWSTDNITYTSVYLAESGVKVPVTIKGDGSISLSVRSCDGTVNSNELEFTVTPAPEIGVNVVQDIAKCGNDITQNGEIQITGYNPAYTYKIGNDVVEPNNEGIIDNLSSAGTFTLSAINSCNAQTSAQFTISSTDNKPYITGATIAQPGKQNKIELTVPDGINAKWSVSPEADLSVSEGNSTMFSAETNDTYTITATNGTCSATHEVTVADAFYIYFRNAKKGETAYANFYDPNQNTEEVQGGEMFYAECDALPTNGNNSLPTHFVNYNKGGRKADIITTDCDGYTWYGFKASAEVVAGTKYFYVHATNDKNYNGHYTHTVPTKKALTSDVYYTLGTTNHTTTHYGWNITLASAPYAGPKVHASGDAKFNANNFADFVPLYVVDCSGKEIDYYQWQYSETENGKYDNYSSVCTYVGKKTESGDAGRSNNIRVKDAGYYRCIVTYKDGKGTSTSNSIKVTNTTSDTPATLSFTSNLPIIMVNTNGVGFPDCTGLSDQTASKNASTFKEKRSVDVKIYEGETLVYDRKARMNYRGSSSLNFVKKSYAFCPGEANCEEKDGKADYVKTAKLNMLGLGEAYDKDWVLYAAAADPSLMRNRLVFDSYAAMTGEWGVQSRYVELIVDGVYKGVYVFMDKITMNEKRVEVDKKTGFIVKFDKTDREDRVGGLNGVFGDEKTFATDLTGRKDISTYDTSVDQLFEIEYPEKDDYPTGWGNRTTAIKNMFINFENALKDGDFTTVQQYIDYTSWADWFIINEFTKNVDAYRASCIFVYTGKAGAKIEARPLWDQELSFNNTATTVGNGKGCNSTADLLINNDGVYTDGFPAPFWFTGNYSTSNGQFTKDKYKGLLDDPCFVQVVKERWETHKAGALSEASLQGRITEYYNDLADYDESTKQYAVSSGKTREVAFWTGKSRGACDCSYNTGDATATGYSNVTMDASKGTMDTWVLDAQRRAGLSKALSGLTGASFSIQIIPSEAKTTPWEPVEIAVSVTPAGYDYKLEYTDNDLGSVANTIIKEEGDKITYRIPRPSAWGAGDAEEGTRADVEYGIKATLSVQEGTTVCGSQAAPSSTGKIILQDEDNDNCK